MCVRDRGIVCVHVYYVCCVFQWLSGLTQCGVPQTSSRELTLIELAYLLYIPVCSARSVYPYGPLAVNSLCTNTLNLKSLLYTISFLS